MCGITGFFSTNNTFSQNDLCEMAKVINHRGPDAKGTFFENGIGLAHQRLSIIDLSTEANQPMHSACGRYSIVFNGEAYNYIELGKSEKLKLKTSSDTEVILQLFIKKGPNFIKEVNGMYAFAIFDKKEKCIWIYRDRIGIKPLFMYQNGSDFAFASEIKSLVNIHTIKNTLKANYSSCTSFLHYGYIPEPATIYDKIEKFPSGCYAKIDSSGINTTRYWNSYDCISENVITNEKEAVKQLDNLINQSIKYRLRSDVDFGAFLSGGIDSSIVAAIAQKQLNAPLKTFTIAFDNEKYNEAKFAKQVANKLKTDHHEFTVTQQTAKDLVGNILDIMDEPFADSSIIPTMMVSQLASKHVKMTLSGDGGDELFMGYGAYNWANRLSSKKINALKYPISIGLNMGNNRHKRAAYMFKYRNSDNLQSHIFSQEQYLFSRKELQQIQLQAYSPYIPERIKYKRQLEANELQAVFDLNHYLKDDLLVKIDRATMQHSIEGRVPLLDHNIVEFALNVHHSLKMNGGTQKYLLKQVLYQYLPKEIFDRPKWGFSIPLNEWLKTDLKYFIDENLNKDIVERVGFINYKYVERLKHLYFNKNYNYLYNRLWVLSLLHKFLKKL